MTAQSGWRVPDNSKTDPSSATPTLLDTGFTLTCRKTGNSPFQTTSVAISNPHPKNEKERRKRKRKKKKKRKKDTIEPHNSTRTPTNQPTHICIYKQHKAFLHPVNMLVTQSKRLLEYYTKIDHSTFVAGIRFKKKKLLWPILTSNGRFLCTT